MYCTAGLSAQGPDVMDRGLANTTTGTRYSVRVPSVGCQYIAPASCSSQHSSSCALHPGPSRRRPPSERAASLHKLATWQETLLDQFSVRLATLDLQDTPVNNGVAAAISGPLIQGWVYKKTQPRQRPHAIRRLVYGPPGARGETWERLAWLSLGWLRRIMMPAVMQRHRHRHQQPR